MYTVCLKYAKMENSKKRKFITYNVHTKVASKMLTQNRFSRKRRELQKCTKTKRISNCF